MLKSGIFGHFSVSSEDRLFFKKRTYGSLNLFIDMMMIDFYVLCFRHEKATEALCIGFQTLLEVAFVSDFFKLSFASLICYWLDSS